MLSIKKDCFRIISSYLCIYHKIILSRVCKATAEVLKDIIENDPALPKQSFAEKLFCKPPRIILLKKVKKAIQPQSLTSNLELPPLALRVQSTNNYRLVFFKDHLELHSRVFFSWDLEKTIKTPIPNHFLCANKYLVNYDDKRIVATMLSSGSPMLIPYSKGHPVLNTKSAFCYASNNQTVVFTDMPRPLKHLGFTFMHESTIFLHLIAETFIVHYNLKTHESVVDPIYVPKVLSAVDDVLICETAIIQLNTPKSHVIYKK